jgi:hypothetical protein
LSRLMTDIAFNLSLVNDGSIVLGLKSQVIEIEKFGGGEITTLLDLREGFPVVLYLDLKLDSVPSLNSLLKLIFPNFQSLSLVRLDLRDVSVFWSAKGGLLLPTGTMSLPPGFSFEGEVTLNGLDMFMFLHAKKHTKVQGIFQCMRIDIEDSSGDTILSISRADSDTMKERGKERFIDGPIFQYSSGSSSNEMEASLKVSFLGKSFSVSGSLGPQSLEFPLSLSLSSNLIKDFELNFDLNYENREFDSFQATGGFTIAPALELTFQDHNFGTIDFPEFRVDVRAELGRNGVKFHLEWSVELNSLSAHYNITVTIASWRGLMNFPSLIVNQMKAEVGSPFNALDGLKWLKILMSEWLSFDGIISETFELLHFPLPTLARTLQDELKISLDDTILDLKRWGYQLPEVLRHVRYGSELELKTACVKAHYQPFEIVNGFRIANVFFQTVSANHILPPFIPFCPPSVPICSSPPVVYPHTPHHHHNPPPPPLQALRTVVNSITPFFGLPRF